MHIYYFYLYIVVSQLPNADELIFGNLYTNHLSHDKSTLKFIAYLSYLFHAIHLNVAIGDTQILAALLKQPIAQTLMILLHTLTSIYFHKTQVSYLSSNRLSRWIKPSQRHSTYNSANGLPT